MNTFKKFKVNSKESSLERASHSLTGLMSKEDKILLDSLVEANKSENANNITINAPELDIINQEFDSYNSQIETNSKKIERLNSLIESQGYCGRVWDESSSNPTAKTYCGNLDMLRNLPDILGLGGYLVQNDHTRRKLSPTNHYKFADDNSEAKLDGSMGHYQWGWNKPFYITTWKENNLHYECVSLEPIKGRESYYIPVGSMSAAGYAAYEYSTERLVSYINEGNDYMGGLNSGDVYPNDIDKTNRGRCKSGLTIIDFAEAARKNGQGWYAGTMRMHSVMSILFHIIMGTRQAFSDYNENKDINGLYQGGLGIGVSNIFDDYQSWTKYKYVSNPYIHMSVGVEKGDVIGMSNELSLTYTNLNNVEETVKYNVPIFFGLKNPFGYMYVLSEDEFVVYENDNTYIHYIRKSMYDENYIIGKINDSVYKLSSLFIDSYENYVKDISYNKLENFPIEYSRATLYTYYSSDIQFSYTGTEDKNSNVIMYNGTSQSLSNNIHTILCTYNLGVKASNISTFLCEFTEDFLLEPIKR